MGSSTSVVTFEATILLSGRTATGDERAKSAATRERRIAGCLAMAREGRG